MGAPSLKNGYAMFKKLVCQWVKNIFFTVILQIHNISHFSGIAKCILRPL